METIKQNKNNYSFSKIRFNLKQCLIWLFVFAVVFSSFTFINKEFVQADSSSFANLQEYTSSNRFYPYSDWNSMGTYVNNTYDGFIGVASSKGSDSYYFGPLVMITDADKTNYGIPTYYVGSNVVNNINNWRSVSINNETFWICTQYWTTGGSSKTPTTTVVTVGDRYGSNFDTSTQEWTDFANYVSSGGSGGSTTLEKVTIQLPPGNMVYIPITSQTTYVNTTVTMPVLNGLFGSASTGYWFGVTQRRGFSNSLPTSNTSIPDSNWNTILWVPTAPKNFLGQSKNAFGSETFSNRSGYYVIYNPLYYLERDGGNGAESQLHNNGTITITANYIDQSEIKVYGLTTTGTIGPSTPDNLITSTLDGNEWSGTVDQDTGVIQWEDQDGNISSPTTGGGNIATNGMSINDWLKNIADQIGNFFQGAIGAVSTLISAASDFVHSISGLYSWLPSPVYSVLISALILAITIGVIKVFI